MKYILASLLLISTAYAKNNCSVTSQSLDVLETVVINSDVPNHLKGAKIVVYLNDGKSSTVPAELFKVVPRRQERLISKVAKTTTETCREFAEHKNRVSLLAGQGPKSGLTKDVSPGKVEIESRTGAVGGLQYQRLLNERISVGVQGQTNKSGALMIGLEF